MLQNTWIFYSTKFNVRERCISITDGVAYLWSLKINFIIIDFFL